MADLLPGHAGNFADAAGDVNDAPRPESATRFHNALTLLALTRIFIHHHFTTSGLQRQSEIRNPDSPPWRRRISARAIQGTLTPCEA